LIGLLSRVGFVLIFFSVYRAHLWYAGGGILISALVSGLGYLILWRKLTPQLHIRFSYFDRARLGQLSGMGGWTFINQVGGMLLDRVDIVVVNAFFGAAITGAYGAVLQISVLVETVVSTISTVIRPVILLKYSQNDFIGLKYLAFRSVKLFGLALAVPVGLICGLARPLLIIWLGPSYAYLSILLIIVVCHMSLNLSVKPLNYIHNAYNRVKWPGLVLLLAGAASAGADIIIARYGNWGYLGIAASTGLIWTMKNVIFVPIYTSHIMKQPWWTYLPSLRWSIIGTLFVGLISYGLSVVYVPSNLLTLALMALLVSLIYSGIVWGFGLENSDKLLLLDLLPGKKLEGIRNLLIR
jgi:O-antigen/teichoic acid export membrane protein